MNNDPLIYYTRRFAEESALAAVASCAKSAEIHRDLASRYARLVQAPAADVTLISQGAMQPAAVQTEPQAAL